MAISILGISIALQFTAAFLSLYLIKITGKWTAWILISIALIFMGIRRSVTFYRLVSGDTSLPPDITAELLALVISLLMLVGVICIIPIFKKIQESNKLLFFKRFSIHNANDSILWINSNACFIYVNDTACQKLGYTREELLTMQVSDIDPMFKQDNWNDYQEDWKNNGVTIFESKYKSKSGEIFQVEIKILSYLYEDEQVLCVIASDITHRKRSEHVLTYQATHDALTSLVNRVEFERRAERLISTVKQRGGEHAICYIDLDQFKVVNDTCGHTAGDELLRQISSLLYKTVRKRDTLARLGGDEFGIIIEHCSLKDAHRVADSLLDAIKDYQFEWEDHTFKVGMSIGLVSITDAVTTLSEVLMHADIACYMAKEMGRNRIHVYHPEDDNMVNLHSQMQWVGRINQALEQGRFVLYAQPILYLDGGVDVYYEFLLRMVDEQGKIILPGYFLPAAERYNLMGQIDRWVVKHSFELLSKNPDFINKTKCCSINISGQSLMQSDFLDFIVESIDRYKINGEKICFEITETSAISNFQMAKNFMSALKKCKCHFALDDFGSGLSSFGYLKNLEVDYLKIDGQFVRDIMDNETDFAMVKSINDIGHTMQMQTIAEFVENEKIKNKLTEIGIDYAQGFFIGKPQPLTNLLQMTNVA